MVVCHAQSHIAVDECGAVEQYSHGARLIGLNTPDGKLTPGAIGTALAPIQKFAPNGDYSVFFGSPALNCHGTDSGSATPIAAAPVAPTSSGLASTGSPTGRYLLLGLALLLLGVGAQAVGRQGPVRPSDTRHHAAPARRLSAAPR